MSKKKRMWVFSGKMGSGKSTYSSAVEKFFGKRAHRVKFADVLYQLHDVCLPILKATGVRPMDMTKDGELLQILGTEYGRNKLGENVWVDACKRTVDKILAEDPENIVIIDDCRFENEFNAFHNDSHMIRLVCPEEVRKQRCSYWRDQTNHISETGLDEYERKNMFHVNLSTDKNLSAEEGIEHLLKFWDYIQ